MNREVYINYLNDLTDKERSVFLYCFVLKLSQDETAKSLQLSIHKVNSIVKNINMEIDILPFKQEILEAFNI